jgi:hypothetical protein
VVQRANETQQTTVPPQHSAGTVSTAQVQAQRGINKGLRPVSPTGLFQERGINNVLILIPRATRFYVPG